MADGLAILGLAEGETVRWRPPNGGRWQTGTVVRRERDGSIGVTDGRGLSRSLSVERLEVACTGRRGARQWEPLSERAARSEQLRLL
ncbi:MAG TPA: hypothetical protein VNF71_05910 [Acidimicrobiales bacterium]|nr:hypothetical protein [Acidimicrobiales bacterium]